MRLTQRLRQRRGVGEGYGGVRLLCAVLLTAGLVGVFPAPGQSYPCVSRDAGKSQRAERPCRPPRRAPARHRHSSFAELAFAGTIFLAILLVPVVPKNLSLWDDERRRGRY